MEKFESPEEYREALMACYIAASLLCGLRLDDLHRAQQHAQSIGPIVDPTLYRAKARCLDEDVAIVAALRKGVAALPKDIRDRLARRMAEELE